jgi:PAS domain S-box-containing protein
MTGIVARGQLKELIATHKKRTFIAEIAMGVAAAVIAVGIRFALPIRPEQLPTATVVIMLALVTTFVGLRAGIVTALLGGLASWYLFLNPPLSWSLANGAWISLLGYMIVAVVILTTSELYRTSERLRHEKEIEAAAWRGAIVDNSDDAVLSKTLDGIIMSWNAGATRLFGYLAEEAIGQPVTLVIPDDRLHEEADILRRLRAGERIDHFETVRRRKDGTLIEISLTVSPVRNAAGEILGASKIARDITAQKLAAAKQTLLLQEMGHRIKNLFAVTSGLVRLSARTATSVDELADDLAARLMALARAHHLTLPDLEGDTGVGASTTLLELLEAILSPHKAANAPERITIDGDKVPLGGRAFTSIALLFHELATNATKYGALSVPEGRLTINVAARSDEIGVRWVEAGIAIPEAEPGSEGFGATLERAALRAINGTIHRTWSTAGLAIDLRFPRKSLVD